MMESQLLGESKDQQQSSSQVFAIKKVTATLPSISINWDASMEAIENALLDEEDYLYSSPACAINLSPADVLNHKSSKCGAVIAPDAFGGVINFLKVR
jgi:hypothetical protein